MIVRSPCFLALALCFAPILVRAHLPLESTLTISVEAEEREVLAVLTESSARALLTPPPEEPLTAVTLDQNRSRLLAVAPKVCTLLDPNGRIIPPTRILVSLSHGSEEVQFLFLYPAAATVARLRAEFLEEARSGSFATFADQTVSPPLRAILMHGRSSLSLSPVSPP